MIAPLMTYAPDLVPSRAATRPRLMAKLEAFVDEVRASGIVRALVCVNLPRLTLSEKLLPISGRRRCDERNLVINRLLAPHLIAFRLPNFRVRFYFGRVICAGNDTRL